MEKFSSLSIGRFVHHLNSEPCLKTSVLRGVGLFCILVFFCSLTEIMHLERMETAGVNKCEGMKSTVYATNEG